MPGIKICIRLNLEDLVLLIMMVVGVIIAIHTILNAILPPSNPATMVVIIPRQVALIAP
jgi:hypothetical protein